MGGGGSGKGRIRSRGSRPLVEGPPLNRAGAAWNGPAGVEAGLDAPADRRGEV